MMTVILEHNEKDIRHLFGLTPVFKRNPVTQVPRLLEAIGPFVEKYGKNVFDVYRADHPFPDVPGPLSSEQSIKNYIYYEQMKKALKESTRLDDIEAYWHVEDESLRRNNLLMIADFLKKTLFRVRKQTERPFPFFSSDIQQRIHAAFGFKVTTDKKCKFLWKAHTECLMVFRC